MHPTWNIRAEKLVFALCVRVCVCVRLHNWIFARIKRPIIQWSENAHIYWGLLCVVFDVKFFFFSSVLKRWYSGTTSYWICFGSFFGDFGCQSMFRSKVRRLWTTEINHVQKKCTQTESYFRHARMRKLFNNWKLATERTGRPVFSHQWYYYWKRFSHSPLGINAMKLRMLDFILWCECVYLFAAWRKNWMACQLPIIRLEVITFSHFYTRFMVLKCANRAMPCYSIRNDAGQARK